MKPDFKQIKDKMKPKIRRPEDVDTPPEAAGDEIDLERENILSQGKNYVKPLSLPHRQALKVTAIILASLILAVVSIFAALIYHYQSDSDIVYGASRVIPFPAGRVDGSFITYQEYLFELKTLKTSASSQIGGEDGQGIDFTTEEGQEQLETLKTMAMTEAQRKKIIRNLAKEENVRISRSELDEEIDHFVQQEGGQDQLEQAIDNFFGWSMRDFRGVIRLQMIERELIRGRADNILTRVRDGEDFAELAQQFSSDGSAADGGDLGFVNEETPFVEEFLEAALALEVGEVSDPVRSQFGYHIIKATDESDEGIRVSHILIDSSYVQRQAQERLESANSSVYLDINI